MDLAKLKKPTKRRNYVAVANTTRRMKEKDLLFLNDSFTQLTHSSNTNTFHR